MTTFDKAKFNWDGMYLTYGEDRKFVSRFKYRGGDRAGFTKFLISNFTVEEYFDMYASGIPPLKILETKGYMSATVKKLLVSIGYTPDAEGRRQYLNAAAHRALNNNK